MPLTNWPTITDDSGTKTDGTIINKALFDAIKDSIEDELDDISGQAPNDTTAEVVAARGSKSTLDERLDVALNEDGTLKESAGSASQDDLESQIGADDIAINGDMLSWSGGSSAAPDGWVLAGAAGTIARTGSGEGDTFTFGAGKYAAKITRAGTNVTLTQTVVASGEAAYLASIKGVKSISVFAKGKTAIANHLRIIVNDGVTTSASSYHAGDGNAANLTVTHDISASATKLEVYASVESSNGAAYVGGFMIVFSDLAPSAWVPTNNRHPVFLAGHSIEAAKITAPAGYTMQVPARALGVIASGGSLNGSDPFTVTIRGNTLAVDEFSRLKVTVLFETAANAATKSIVCTFGTISLTLGASAFNSAAVFGKAEFYITRQAYNVEIGLGVLQAGTATTGAITDILGCKDDSGTTDLTADVSLTVVGTSSGVATDITLRDIWVEVLG